MIDTSYLVSNDAAVRRVRDLDALLDKAFGTESEIRAQITALTEEPAGDATWTAPRLQVGESRKFRITGLFGASILIQVYRVDSDLYVVTVAVDGALVPHFTQTWTPERSPDGDVRRAAWDYIQSVAADFGGSVRA
jgi:hypothetical protein